jgi:3-hydroxyacyl-CoA dehydrogenase/enoyl-CoA hydratase/3-hydroxybutyryl-CoA epimerase
MAGSALSWELADGIAVVTLDMQGEAVNKISRSLKADFLATFESLEREGAVRGVAFFSGKPDNFIAGADIEEFVALTSAAEAERLVADGQELLERVARFPKPIAVGIHGACLGGGLEFALACHYRVASEHAKTQLGLPEVQLGILPAAGGCQRLPRLIGARAALDIILAGKVERAQKAFRLGIVDELVHPAILRDITIAAAQRMAGGWRPRRKRPGGFTGWLLDGNPLGRRLVFHGARKQVLKQTKRNYPAPLAALEAVEYGLAHGLPQGLKREAHLFGQLAVTDVSRKLVQIFFATSQLKKDFGVPNPPPPAEVRRLGVVGSGFMGSGIAGTAVVQAAVDVRMKDADLPRVAKGLAAAREILDERLRRRRLTKYEHARLVALLSGADTYAGFGRADLVIEAVFEDLTVKRQVLGEVEAVTPERAVFASNTSTIPIGRIAEAARRPEQVIGMHFFSPVARMPLLEVIPSARTAPGVVTTAVAFGRRMGKTAIVVKDSPGFWVNRILTPYMNEAGHLLAEGTAIEELDDRMVQFGFPVGPITLLDEVGMDVAEKVAGVMHAAFGDRFAPAPAFAALVKAGRLGRKAGKGFYTYARGKKGGVDAAVYQLIGTQPNGGPRPAEAIQRLVLVMLNEAARAVGEGIVTRPRDGDIAAVFGFGFPPFRGGPLRHADDLGAQRLVDELQRLAERLGSRFAPCEVLQEQARRGSKFYP